ncbi:prepilin-type N-terminal cleavage/methylation domain-containing protein [Demequina sp. SYSU T00068]|uniref:PulJ/GspJ family protein n=1 Tax=Demequina lignilytica TaxID=3051663 RepID=UPI00261FC47C|nr:prepilin-type N-terminal cleavage/methylation domain-containing protein [Demequina sp. SYSU T00068]MDN4489395.1 prepilin-type N-terminal cleavage/methylation domain-containing protein [Demequina sp. SYSU T00068]
MIPKKRDDGFTLVELLAYILILAVVMAIAVAYFIQLINHQGHVRDTAEAGDSAQLAFKAMETDVRSSSWAIVAHGGDLLVLQSRVVTSAGSDAERCVGFYFNASTGDVHRTTSTSGAETKAALAAPDDASAAAVAADWPVLVSNVDQNGGSQVFGPGTGALGRGDSVEMDLVVETSDDWPSWNFQKSIALRPQSSEILDCY